MGRHGESEAHVHARRVVFDRRIEEPLHLGEGHDLVELAPNLGARHAQDGAVQEDIFAAAEFGVKAGADLEQRGDPAANGDAPRRRLGDAREDLQQGGFARAVAADDADDFAALHLERHVAQRPKFLGLKTGCPTGSGARVSARRGATCRAGCPGAIRARSHSAWTGFRRI